MPWHSACQGVQISLFNDDGHSSLHSKRHGQTLPAVPELWAPTADGPEKAPEDQAGQTATCGMI